MMIDDDDGDDDDLPARKCTTSETRPMTKTQQCMLKNEDHGNDEYMDS